MTAQHQPCGLDLNNFSLNSGPEPGTCATVLGVPDAPPICNLYDLSSGTEAADLPLVTFRINFHLIGVTDSNGTYYNYDPDGIDDAPDGQFIMNEAVQSANSALSTLVIDPMNQNNGVFNTDFVGDSRMRVEIYTETSNTDDQYGGIWYHESQADYDSFVLPYDGLVTHVIVRADSVVACGSNGGTSCSGTPIVFRGWYSSDADPNCTTWGFWEWGKTLTHELLHNAGLCHTFGTQNECYAPNDPTGLFADVDPFLACEKNDSLDYNSSPLLNYPPDLCGSSHGIQCNWGGSGSRNYMNYGVAKRSLTKCQWTVAYRSLAEGRVPESDLCDRIEDDLVIPSGTETTWNKLKLIKNRAIVIESGAKLVISGCQVRMAKDAVFKVKRGGKLEVINSTITNLCPDNRWGGIYVEGNVNKEQPLNADSPQQSDDAGILEMNTSTLTHASHSIVTYRHGQESNSDYYGGLVDCKYVYFLDNKRAAAFYKYGKNNNSSFENCTITNTLSDSFSAESTRGISVWACKDINFKDNTFSNLAYGILSYDAKLNVTQGNMFRNLEVGVDIYATYPEGSYDRIGDETLSAGNTFDDNDLHIQINAGNSGGQTDILFNNFEGNGPGIVDNTAIWLEGEHRLDVFSNAFDGNFSSLEARHGGKDNIFFDCNFSDNGGLGIGARGQNSFLIFNFNDFDGQVASVVISDLGGSSGEIFELQGEIAPNPLSPSNLFQSSNDILTYGETNNFSYVTPNLASPIYTPAVGSNNFSLLNLQIEESECSDRDWGKLIGAPPYGHTDLSEIKDIENIRKEAAAAEPDNLDKKQAYSKATYEKQVVLDWLLKQAINSNDFALAESYLTAETEKHFKKSVYGMKVKAGNYVDAENYLSTYPLEDIFDEEFVNLQEINLDFLVSGVPAVLSIASTTPSNYSEARNGGFELNEEQYTYIKNIAFSDSPNRSTARALLAVIKGERYVNHIDKDFYFKINRDVRNEQKNDLFIVYPNPNKGHFKLQTLSNSNTVQNNLSVEIIDIHGKIISIKKNISSQSDTEFDISDLANGIYFLVVKQGKLVLQTEKVIRY